MDSSDTQNKPNTSLPKPTTSAVSNSGGSNQADLPQTPIDPAITPAPKSSPTGVSTPATADDNDLIEKEWVDKAKHIVEKTRNDPHLQNKEINQIKADYIKKRYNKNIKLIDK